MNIKSMKDSNGNHINNNQNQDIGSSPQPQIRVRKENFRQKPSQDLAKFEERLLLDKNDPEPKSR